MYPSSHTGEKKIASFHGKCVCAAGSDSRCTQHRASGLETDQPYKKMELQHTIDNMYYTRKGGGLDRQSLPKLCSAKMSRNLQFDSDGGAGRRSGHHYGVLYITWPPSRPSGRKNGAHLQLCGRLPRGTVDALKRRPVLIATPVSSGKRLQLDRLRWKIAWAKHNETCGISSITRKCFDKTSAQKRRDSR